MTTAYDKGYAAGLRGHTDYFRPSARYSATSRAEYACGYINGAQAAHEAGLPEARRLAALNLPRAHRQVAA